MKYFLFCGDDFYPDGGAHDFHSVHDTAEDAVQLGKTLDESWFNVMDEKGKMVASWAYDSSARGMIDILPLEGGRYEL